MLKKNVQYEDYNGKNTNENLYFNVSKSELSDHLELVAEVEHLQDMLAGDERELTVPEVRILLDLVKKLIRMSYGRRSDDGRLFYKNDSVWNEFIASAAYDALLMNLFTNPEEAVSFIVGIMPRDLVEQAKTEQGITDVELPEPATDARASFESRPPLDPEKIWSDFSETELNAMPDSEFDRLYNKIAGPKPGILVAIAMRRKNQ